jgi:hypothetical protein
MANPKSQIPNPKDNPTHVGIWDLGFGIYWVFLAVSFILAALPFRLRRK